MITGMMLRDAMISAANNVQNHRQSVDALNVFPVPDGDTGTNMSMTMNAAKKELQALPNNASVHQVASTAASALLRGARGNSGVITSLLFRGFSKGLKDKTTADARDVVTALEIGVENAYKAVMKPTEGTMLTVARLSAESAKKALSGAGKMAVTDLWQVVLDSSAKALAQTPELLPVLKKAGVVDAGGQGLLYIYKGMEAVFGGGAIVPLADGEAAASEESIHPDYNAAGEFLGEITFTYCTEFIVIKNERGGDALKLRAFLESIGDSAVVVDDDEIIKCHVHTDNPGDAIQEALKFGMLTKLKIDNMRLQHEEQQQAVAAQKQNKVPVDPDRPSGFVAVAAGEGVHRLFTDLGVDNVVRGGQTMNPSTEDILQAVEATPSATVYVLPNNKNIIMAAEQAAKICKTRTVKVIPTKTVPQGLGAMLAFEHSDDTAANTLAMTKAAERVGTGQITFAARDSDYDGHKIKEGELLALENGKVSFTERDLKRAVNRLIKALLKKDSSFVTLIYGEDVTAEQAAEVEASVREKLPKEVDLALVPGEQPVYYFIISVE